jgi:hypothetical protein
LLERVIQILVRRTKNNPCSVNAHHLSVNSHHISVHSQEQIAAVLGRVPVEQLLGQVGVSQVMDPLWTPY